MTNTPNLSQFAAEQLYSNLRELARSLDLYGTAMPSNARTERVEAFNWALAELHAGGRAELASKCYQLAEAADITAMGIHYPNRAVALAAAAVLNLRAAAGQYAGDDSAYRSSEGVLPAHIEKMTEGDLTAYLLANDADVAESDRMAGPDDDRPHPDGE